MIADMKHHFNISCKILPVPHITSASRSDKESRLPRNGRNFSPISLQDLRIIHHRSYLYAVQSRISLLGLLFRCRGRGHTILHFRGSNSLNLGSARGAQEQNDTRRCCTLGYEDSDSNMSSILCTFKRVWVRNMHTLERQMERPLHACCVDGAIIYWTDRGTRRTKRMIYMMGDNNVNRQWG